MTKPPRYLLGDEWFRTKDEMQQRISQMLHSYPLGARTTIEDTEILLDLLQHHPSAEKKIGCGIVAFEVRCSPFIQKQRCFYLIRADGSEEDFSYIKCLRPPTPWQEFHAICRHLIRFDQACFKDAHFRDHARQDGCIQCPITGEWVEYERAHVDHIPPLTFAHLVKTFIEEHNIDVKTVPLREVVVGKDFADDQLSQSWVAFHRQHAQLRVVSAYANQHIIPKLAREQDDAAD